MEFIAPLFRGDLSHRILDGATILPFTVNRKIRQGAFGTVYEVIIDARHQADAAGAHLPSISHIVDETISLEALTKVQDLRLVRKEIGLPSAVENLATPLDARDAFDHEGRVLSFLRLIRYPNIVRLIGSYSYRDTYNLLFERAESDLSKLCDDPSTLTTLANFKYFL
jgi:serine/threonine protein kinase